MSPQPTLKMNRDVCGPASPHRNPQAGVWTRAICWPTWGPPWLSHVAVAAAPGKPRLAGGCPSLGAGMSQTERAPKSNPWISWLMRRISWLICSGFSRPKFPHGPVCARSMGFSRSLGRIGNETISPALWGPLQDNREALPGAGPMAVVAAARCMAANARGQRLRPAGRRSVGWCGMRCCAREPSGIRGLASGTQGLFIKGKAI
jgi:hypothetical protein